MSPSTVISHLFFHRTFLPKVISTISPTMNYFAPMPVAPTTYLRQDYSSSYRDWLLEQSEILEHRGSTRQSQQSSIASQVCTISRSRLRHYRKNARDHGHLDHFLREADEAFADEMAEAYGVSRVPVPLMIPLPAGLYLPLYAVLLEKGWRDQACWESYCRGLAAIMQRVGRRMGVDTTVPTMYLEVIEGDYDSFGYVGEVGRVTARTSVARDTYNSTERLGTRVEASATGASVYLQ